MSRGTLLSVTAMYSYNNSLFDNMVFPTQFTEDDKETTKGNILAECAELEVLFTDFDFLKDMIGLWSKLNIPVWQRIYSASLLEYNPIENYNRTEIETITDDKTETHSGNDTNRTSGSDATTSSGNSTETNSGTDTETNKNTAYDSNSAYVHDISDLAHGHTIGTITSGGNTTTYGKTDTLTHGEVIEHEGDITRENHTSGNIGITTSQQMLTQETEIAVKLNVMKMIVDSFKSRFCLLVY